MNSFKLGIIHLISLCSITGINLSIHQLNASQPQVQPRFINTYSFSTSEIWNIDIYHSEKANVSVNIHASISDINGNLIVEISSQPYYLQIGLNSLNPTKLLWSRIYYSKGFEETERLLGSLPYGNYQVCYIMKCSSSDCDGLGENVLNSESSQCFPLQVEQPTPLMLASPSNQAVIQWPRPDFHWIPPMPLSGVNGFNYSLELFTKNENQTCEEVAMVSRPLFKINQLTTNWSNYPSDMSDLDTSRSYCWKVNGWIDNSQVALSEVWEFEFESPKKELKDTFWYYELKTTPDAHIIQLKQGEDLYFTAKDYTPSKDIELKVYDDKWILVSTVLVKISKDSFQKVIEDSNLKSYGENKFSLKDPSSYLPEGIYYIEVHQSIGRKYYLKFKL